MTGTTETTVGIVPDTMHDLAHKIRALVKSTEDKQVTLAIYLAKARDLHAAGEHDGHKTWKAWLHARCGLSDRYVRDLVAIGKAGDGDQEAVKVALLEYRANGAKRMAAARAAAPPPDDTDTEVDFEQAEGSEVVEHAETREPDSEPTAGPKVSPSIEKALANDRATLPDPGVLLDVNAAVEFTEKYILSQLDRDQRALYGNTIWSKTNPQTTRGKKVRS